MYTVVKNLNNFMGKINFYEVLNKYICDQNNRQCLFSIDPVIYINHLEANINEWVYTVKPN